MWNARDPGHGPPLSWQLPYVGLGLYLVLGIFYVFPSGNPQPADYFLVAVIALTALLTWRQLPTAPMLYLTLALFIGWIIIVNCTWYLMIGDVGFLRRTSFYVYNGVVFLFVVVTGWYDLARLKKAVWLSCVIALALQVVLLHVFPDETARATGTFNNPNQMGYWALLMMACLAVAKDRGRLGLVDAAALGAGFYVVMLSLSKAASLSAFVLVGLVVLGHRMRASVAVLGSSVLVIAIVVQLAVGGLIERVVSVGPVAALTARIDSIGQQEDDNAFTRGYGRLILFPQYLALGAGEGAYERLSHDSEVKEFHSTLGSTLMSYGLVGLGLLVALLVTVFAPASWVSRSYLLPIMLYGLTHMGLRFSIFWLFLALVYATARFDRDQAAVAPLGRGRLGADLPSGQSVTARTAPEAFRTPRRA